MTTRVDEAPRTSGRSVAALTNTHPALSVARGDGPGDSTGRGRGSAPPAASASLSTGPTATPWFTTDLTVTDPQGHVVVLTAQREQDAAAAQELAATFTGE